MVKKIGKLFLFSFLLLVMTVSLGLVVVNNIHSATSTLRKTIYVGEKVDWDVTLDGSKLAKMDIPHSKNYKSKNHAETY